MVWWLATAPTVYAASSASTGAMMYYVAILLMIAAVMGMLILYAFCGILSVSWAIDTLTLGADWRRKAVAVLLCILFLPVTVLLGIVVLFQG